VIGESARDARQILGHLAHLGPHAALHLHIALGLLHFLLDLFPRHAHAAQIQLLLQRQVNHSKQGQGNGQQP
jgi:hypothetical protein